MAFTKIIGLDLGHGETAAVCMSADTKQINILNLDDNQTKVIPSVLGIREDGTTALGRNAGEGLDIQKVIAYFKRSPDHFEEKVMGLTRRDADFQI